MSTRASIKGHPIHATLIVLPAGLFVFSFISDLFYMNTGRESWDTWPTYDAAVLGVRDYWYPVVWSSAARDRNWLRDPRSWSLTCRCELQVRPWSSLNRR